MQYSKSIHSLTKSPPNKQTESKKKKNTILTKPNQTKKQNAPQKMILNRRKGKGNQTKHNHILL